MSISTFWSGRADRALRGSHIEHPTVQLVRLDLEGHDRWVVRTADSAALLPVSLDDLLQVSLDEARAAVESAAPTAHLGGALLAPIE